jgi:hypothetical protein
MKLTYAVINNVQFVDSLRKLVNHPFPIKIGYHIGRIQDKIMSESKVAQAAYQKLINEKVEWNPAPEGKHPIFDRTPKDMGALKAIETEFLTIEFTIDKNPIHIQDLHTMQLTPLEIMALEPILTGLETLEDSDEENSEKSDKESGLKIASEENA